MGKYLVTVAIENGNPNFPPDLHFYAVGAASREKAEERVKELINVPILAFASRAVPQQWPTYDGEVVVI